MKTIDEVIELIDQMLHELEKPLTFEMQSHGWSEGARQAYLKWFSDLRKDLLEGTSDIFPTLIARSMDHWGIVDGDLLNLGARIGNLLREIEDQIRNPELD